MNSPEGEFVVALLGEQHDRSQFSCGVEALDRYFREQAGQDARRRVASVYTLCPLDARAAVGFYTLANSVIQLSELPVARVKKLPRYPQVPATLLGRLAVDLRYRGRGLGEFLLFDAMHRSLKSSTVMASYAFVVDAKDAAARNFYLRYGFESLAGSPMRLFLPMQDIARDFENRP